MELTDAVLQNIEYFNRLLIFVWRKDALKLGHEFISSFKLFILKGILQTYVMLSYIVLTYPYFHA